MPKMWCHFCPLKSYPRDLSDRFFSVPLSLMLSPSPIAFLCASFGIIFIFWHERTFSISLLSFWWLPTLFSNCSPYLGWKACLPVRRIELTEWLHRERDLEKLLLRRNKVAGKFVVVSCGILCRLFSLLQLFFVKMWWALELFSRDLFTFYIFKRKQVENVWLSWFILCLARHFIYPFSFYWHNNVTHWLLLMRYPMLHGLGIVQASDPSHCHPKDMGTC